MRLPWGLLLSLVPEIVRGIFGVVRDALAAKKARADADKAEDEARIAEAAANAHHPMVQSEQTKTP